MKSYAIRNGVRPTITTAEEGTIALVAGDKGAIFYNTDTNSIRAWDGTAFQDVGSDPFSGLANSIQMADGSVTAAGTDGQVLSMSGTTPTWTAPLAPWFPPTFRSSQSVIRASATDTGITITPTFGTYSAGDFMILSLVTAYSSQNWDITIPGWTKHKAAANGTYLSGAIFYKTAGTFESAFTVTPLGNDSTQYSWPMALLTTFKDTSGIEAFTDTWADTTDTASAAVAGITGTVNSLEVLISMAGDSGATDQVTWATSGTGWTEAGSVANTNSFYHSGISCSQVAGGSPIISPNDCTIGTTDPKKRIYTMLRLGPSV